jgi:hypothetical protein
MRTGIQRSTKQGNPNVARQLEAAYRTSLVKGEVGIIERKRIPEFREAMAGFLKWSEVERSARPATFRRYKVSSVALLRYFKGMALDKIKPEEVDRFKIARLAQFKTVKHYCPVKS